MLDYTIFGESHGPAVGVFIQNIPAGLPVDGELIHADLLRRKVDKLENVEVTITPEIVSASAQVKLGGRMADLHLEGVLFDDNGSVYFRMTKLDIKNALFGKAVIGNFFGDILLINLHALPFSAELDRVVQKDGEVVLMASRHNK